MAIFTKLHPFKDQLPGVHARIQQLHPTGYDTYLLGDEIAVPVADIEATVQAPSVIVQKTDTSTLSALTSEVFISGFFYAFVPYPLVLLQEYRAYTSCHRLELIAGDRPVVMIPLILYSDDASGNKSKQWNRFDSWCVKLAGLPNEENAKLDNIHHISSSNEVVLFMCFLYTLTLLLYLTRWIALN